MERAKELAKRMRETGQIEVSIESRTISIIVVVIISFMAVTLILVDLSLSAVWRSGSGAIRRHGEAGGGVSQQ